MKLLTTSVAASLLALGACSTNEQRGDDIGWDSRPPAQATGPTCLPPQCAYSPGQRQRRTATTAKPTVKPKH